MKMNCSRCEMCAAAADIYASGSFVHYSLLFRLIFEPLCILGISLLSMAVYQTKTLHYNARILLVFLTVSMAICNVGILLEVVKSLYVSYVLPSEIRCEYEVFRPNWSLGLQSFYTVGGLGLATSTIFLAVERIIATMKYKTYEQSNVKWIGTTMFCVQTLIGLITITYILTVPKVLTVPYFHTELMDTEGAKVYCSCLWISNTTSLVIYSVLWIVNKKRTKSLLDSQFRVLSTRYQLRENIQTTRLMVPIMTIVTLMSTSYWVVQRLKLPKILEDSVMDSKMLQEIVEYAPYSQYQTSLIPILTAAMTVLLPMFSPHIKRSFYRISRLDRFLAEETTVDGGDSNETREVYFQRLQGQWKIGPPPM